MGNNKTIWVHLNEFFMIGEEYNVVQTLVRFQVVKKKKEKEKEKEKSLMYLIVLILLV